MMINDEIEIFDEIYIQDEELEDSEKKLLEKSQKSFSPLIKERGENYYNKGNVLECYRTGDTFLAKVKGTGSSSYDVKITLKKHFLDYQCSCPCTFLCKHEYAILETIKNDEYVTVDLKEVVPEKRYSIEEIIKNIPDDEFKEYVLTHLVDNRLFLRHESFEEKFYKYFPRQSYEYYYNNLYNRLVINNDFECLIDCYLKKIKQYIAILDLEEVLKIIKSILNAYIDSKKLNNDEYIIEKLAIIGMYLRILYRKANDELKKEVENWIKTLVDNNYYDNYYLEDIIITAQNVALK